MSRARDPDIAALLTATSAGTAMPIAEVDALVGGPQSTGIDELDRVLGGGLVPGSVTLLGGEPGIGKSTLLLQLAATWPTRTLYVSGEESAQQVRLRAERLGAIGPHLWLLAETSLPHIVAALDTRQPQLVIIDSIQSVADPDLGSAPGSVVQVRGCAHRLVAEAKRRGIPMVLVGHVTKDGGLAGPRVLEHIVDTVLSFEGDRHHALRLLRAVKHRFGSTNELGVFEMVERGLVGRARCQQLVPHRPAHRRRRLCGHSDARGPPTAARRGPGADQQGQLGRAAAAQRPRPRPRPAGAAAGGARTAGQVADGPARGVRVRRRRRAADRARQRSADVPRHRQRVGRPPAAARCHLVR